MTLPTVPARVAEPLKVVRRQAQPTLVLVVRLTTTAVAAYLLAELVPRTGQRPTLAPLTALLVLQVSLYRTLRSAVQRIGSVVGGVLIAVLIASVIHFTWWSLGLAVGSALILGFGLRLGDQILEVPISAMLILSLPSDFNATDRVVETLVGAGTGLLAGLVLSPLRVQPAEDAVEELSRRMAEVLSGIADGLRRRPSPDHASDWLRQARALGREIGRVRRALEDAEESIRLNPRATRLPHAGVALGSGLESLEHFQVYMRGLARSIADSTRRQEEPPYGPGAQDCIADVLDDLASAIRAYGRMVRSEVAGDTGGIEGDLRRSLAAAERHRERASDILVRLPADDPVEWALRGEILAHLDRLIDQLRVEHRTRERERWPHRPPPRRIRRPRGRSPEDRFMWRRRPRRRSVFARSPGSQRD